MKKVDDYFILSKAAKKLCYKYHLRFPIDPTTPYDEKDLLKFRSPINYFIPKEFMRRLQIAFPDGTINLGLIEQTFISHLDRRFAIMIDPMFSKDQIKGEFDKILDDWFKKSKQRVKGNKVDIWEVYRLHQIEGKSLNRIAIEKLASHGTPAYNKEDDRKLKIIERAYRKACRIIATIERLTIDHQ